LVLADWTFAYWNGMSFAESKGIGLVYKWRNGHYEFAPELMRGPPLEEAELRRRASYLDWGKIESAAGPIVPVAGLLGDMLSLVETGNAVQISSYIDLAWPASQPGKAEFMATFYKTLEGDAHLAELKQLNGEIGPIAASQTPNKTFGPHVDEIKTVLDAWVQSMRSGDLETQMNCYAPVLERYFRATNVDAPTLRKWKAVGMAKWPSTRFDLSEMNFQELQPGRFEVEFDKQWDATGASHFTGASRNVLIFQRINDAWKIVNEQETKVYRVSNAPNDKSQTPSMLSRPAIEVNAVPAY
jgi:hypothetical protein